jgi:eukaryotic-like serine/threonine-protein kinase
LLTAAPPRAAGRRILPAGQPTIRYRPEDVSIEAGTIIAGRYEVLGPLGQGGMGEVFRARFVGTGRLLAIKLLHAFARAEGESARRFRREARASGMIVSEHVAQVIELDEDPVHGLVLAFELLIGETLQERIKRRGPLDWPSVSLLIEQTLLGLADAHAAGVVHRDLKPSNVFLERRPGDAFRVKILDFGISKLPAELVDTPLTRPDQAIGSLSFMPPEQLQGAAAVDQRADLYALGTLLFLVLTGELPYVAGPLAELLRKKLHAEPRTLHEASGRAFEPALEAWVKRCLSRSPSQRHASATEALAAWFALCPLVEASLLPAASSAISDCPAKPSADSSRPPESTRAPPSSRTPEL